MVRRRPLPLVERHPERSNSEVGRDDVRRFGLPSGHANGNARDRTGRLITCEHSARRVTRTEYDGSITVIVDRFQGKRLNSPNDVVVASEGAMWVTDPHFRLGSFYEGTN